MPQRWLPRLEGTASTISTSPMGAGNLDELRWISDQTRVE